MFLTCGRETLPLSFTVLNMMFNNKHENDTRPSFERRGIQSHGELAKVIILLYSIEVYVYANFERKIM